MRTASLCLSLAILLSSVPAAGRSVPPCAYQDGLSDLAAKLRAERDDAGPEPIQALAALKSREAALELIAVYSEMRTLFMRREVLRALATFDGQSDAEQPALQKISDAATGEAAVELRKVALDLLAECKHLGKGFLAQIIQSNADDPVRERAMELYVERTTDEDQEFYQKLFTEVPKASKSKTKLKKGQEPEPIVYVLPRIRELALEQLAPKLDADQLVEAATERSRDDSGLRRDGVRRIALAELDRRKDKRAVELARKAYDDVTERPQNRVLAAQILARDEGGKVAATFLDDGTKDWSVTPAELRDALADLVAEMEEKPIQGKLEKLLGSKAKTHEKLFALRALAKSKDEKLQKPIVKLLADPDPQVQIAATNWLALNGNASVRDELEKLVRTGKQSEVKGAALDALGSLIGGTPDWVGKLMEEARSKAPEVRNAALWQLAKLKQSKCLPLFVESLQDSDWATRLAALKGLEILASPEAIETLIAQMSKEEGRMRREICDALWHLTGQPIPPDPKQWEEWWAQTKSGFKGLSTGELYRIQQQEEERRLAQAPANQFYGVRIVSHRVAFIIDVSGSMEESMRSFYAGEQGKPRMEAAKRELAECIRSLEPGTLFNVISFSDGVQTWLQEGIASSTNKDKAEALTYVERLSALGGTNIYGAIEEAFSDPDVDTIYFLSDGEPSVGDVIDAGAIRERVSQWNEHRKLVIHSIAIGGKLQLMEWLATDSGGSYVQFE